MQTQLKQVFRSFILVPFLATSMSITTFNTAVDTAVQEQMQDKAALQAQADREQKAKKIDTYFAKYNMPLAGQGMKMVLEAEKNGLEWSLIPAIAVRETTGGRHLCKNPKAAFNPYGWGSCKIGFKSFENATELLAQHLGGNHKKTVRYYGGKETKAILQTYNPPSVVPTYAEEVMSIMDRIESIEITSV